MDMLPYHNHSAATLPSRIVNNLHQKIVNYSTTFKKSPSNSHYQGWREPDINDSVCLTEENRHISKINPVALVDKDWTDEYKLGKLMLH